MAKNILIVFSDLNNGGAQAQMLKVLKNITGHRFNFFICCLKNKGPMAVHYESEGFLVYCLNMNSRFAIHRILYLYFLLKKLKIDIVYTKGGGDSLFWGSTIGYLAGVKHIISSFHTTGNFPDGKPPVHKFNKFFSFIIQYYICVCNRQRIYYQQYYSKSHNKMVQGKTPHLRCFKLSAVICYWGIINVILNFDLSI